MAVLVLTNPSVTVGGVDVSALCTSVTLNYEVDQIETTSFTNTGHTFTGGLQNVSVDVEMNQDFATSKTEATIYPLVGTQTTVVIIPVNTTVSSTDPRYTVSNTYLGAHSPVMGSVGDLAKTTLKFVGGSLAKATV